jgi:hypothetical protein
VKKGSEKARYASLLFPFLWATSAAFFSFVIPTVVLVTNAEEADSDVARSFGAGDISGDAR